ncbi:hypothetical protein QBC39DRAFT_383138 [Podospora conica]|nr:hypothetical protein QBC39DRAFT_383138 [Schizothecium conicum]
MKLPLLLAALTPLPAALALAPRPTTTPLPSPTRTPAPRCGGLSPDPPRCPAGQACAPTQPPGSFDLPGTCILATCGGKVAALEGSLCPAGQVCVYNATAPVTDLPGRCMAAALTCGGGKKCSGGWECLVEPRVDFAYFGEWEGAGRGVEGGGICVPRGALVVEMPWRGWGV